MNSMFTAATIQFCCQLCSPEYNLQRMERLSRAAKLQDPSVALLVFPELCTTGYECNEAFQQLAEPVNGPSMARLGALCRELECCMLYGFAERANDGSIYNSAAFLSSSGKLTGVYRKVHLFGRETEWFCPGNALPILDTPLGKAGIMICWDVAFPEDARCLALNGADFLLLSSAWEHPYQCNFTLAAQARSYENCLPLVGSNRVGQEPENLFIGHSAIYAPGGKLLTCLGEEEGIAIAPVYCRNSLEEAEYAFFANRRPDLYDPISRLK